MLDEFMDDSALVEVRHVTDYAEADTPDVDLVQMLADIEEEVVFVTQDRKMNKRSLERHALDDSGLKVMFLDNGWSNLSYEEKAWRLVRAWPKVVSECKRTRPSTKMRLAVKNERIRIVD